MTSAVSAHGTILSLDSVPVPECMDFDGPSESADQIDVTNHDSGGRREFIPGVRDGGEISFDMNWFGDPAQVALRTLFTSGDTGSFTLEPPDGEVLTFDAIVTDFSFSFPVNEQQKASVTLKLSGDLAIT